MSKKIKAIVRLQIEAGKANPAPPSVQRWPVMASTSWLFARTTMPARQTARARFSLQKSAFIRMVHSHSF